MLRINRVGLMLAAVAADVGTQNLRKYVKVK